MKSAREFYSDLARAFNAHGNCNKRGNMDGANNAINKIETMVRNYLPSGSGFDSGTKFNWQESNENKLVFNTAFHHMNEGGYYSGWTEHKVIVTPNLMFGFNIKITGRNRNDIKEYIHSCFADFEYKVE